MNYKLEKVGNFRRYKPLYSRGCKILPGSIVKLIFKIHDKQAQLNAERIWVKVISVHNGKFTGIIDNDPIHPNLSEGDKVEFEKIHIYDIYHNA